MKKAIFAAVLSAVIALSSGCADIQKVMPDNKDATIGIIGGADGPTAILVTDGKDNYVRMTLGEQYEKKPIRMFNVDGELYYDSGLVSDMTPRCGTMDGNLKKGVGENEIPHKSGEANFEIDGYQNATGITKEVNIDGEWVIFRKYKYLPEDIDELKYCYYIKGHLSNAAIDSEIVVLTDSKDVTFNDVYEPFLSSQAPAATGYLISHNMLNGDKWGLNLYAEDVTPTGLTLKIEQFGGTHSGELQTGADYFLETSVNDEWQEVETINGQPLSWNALAYMIKENDVTEMSLDWQYAYGELKPGFYRLTKEFIDFRSTGDYDKETYLVHFTIESNNDLTETDIEQIALEHCKHNYDYIETTYDADNEQWQIEFWENGAKLAAQRVTLDSDGNLLDTWFAE